MNKLLSQLNLYTTNVTPESAGVSKSKLANLDPASLTAFIFNTVIGISGAIFMIMLLVGGITYLTGAGNEEQTGKSKKIMVDAVIGLVLTLSAYGIGKMVIDALG